MKSLAALGVMIAAVLQAGCASFDGRGLVPGTSTAAQVAALMGEPAERQKRANGDMVWYYPRLPFGRETYAVTIGPDGVMKSNRQTLTHADISSLRPNTTTREQVRELLGPPAFVARAARKPYEVWEYPWNWREIGDYRILWVSFSDDGVLREIVEMHDWRVDGAGDGGRN